VRIILAVLAVLALSIGGWKLYEYRNQPPEIAFVRPTRETIASEVSTNGKIEPVESAEARAQSSGRVDRILVKLRQNVNAGDTLVQLDTSTLRQELETNAARIREVKEQISSIDAGGRRPERVQLETERDQLRQQRKTAQEEYEKEVRLEAAGVSTRQTVGDRKKEVDRLDTQISGITQRLGALVEPNDRRPLEARIQQLESERQAIQLQIQQAVVKAPIAGTVYNFDLKPGAYLNPGDPVATIGRLDRVRLIVYVDEPDLGRVRIGLPVTISWDSHPGREWMGTVDRLPTQIQSLDSRQVGEVICIIQNPGMDLIPGANVTARIRAEVVENALTLPKEAIFHQETQAGVYALSGDHVQWKPVTQGVNNVTRVEVKELTESDLVAVLTSDRALADGMQVRPKLPESGK
jgi:HlyD family secretion protein